MDLKSEHKSYNSKTLFHPIVHTHKNTLAGCKWFWLGTAMHLTNSNYRLTRWKEQMFLGSLSHEPSMLATSPQQPRPTRCSFALNSVSANVKLSPMSEKARILVCSESIWVGESSRQTTINCFSLTESFDTKGVVFDWSRWMRILGLNEGSVNNLQLGHTSNHDIFKVSLLESLISVSWSEVVMNRFIFWLTRSWPKHSF